MQLQFLTAKQLVSEFPFWKSVNALYMARCRGTAPPAVSVNGGTLRWRRADVEAWIASKLEQPEGAVQP